MKVIYINFKFIILLLYILFSCLNNNVLVECQLSSSNQDVILKDYTLNKYENYGSYQRQFKECYLLNRYMVTNLTTTTSTPFISNIVVPPELSINVNNLNGLFQVYGTLPTTNTNYTIQFTISDSADTSFSTDFTFNYYCEDFDFNTLEVELSDNYSKISPSSQYFNYYLKIKNLKRPLDNLFITYNSSLGYYISSTTINSELYQVSIQLQKNSLFFSLSISFTVYFPQKSFNFTLNQKSTRDSIYQSIDYQTYPNVESTTTTSSSSSTEFIEYNQIGNGVNALLKYSTNVSDIGFIPSFSLVYQNGFYGSIYTTKIGQVTIGGLSKYTYIAQIDPPPSNSTYTLEYVNGPSNEAIKLIPFKYNEYKQIDIPTGSLNQINGLISFEFNSSSSSQTTIYDYRNSPFYHYYYGYSLVTQFPFGFASGNNNQFNYKSCYYGKPTNNKFSYYYFNEYPVYSTPSQYPNPIQDTTTDTQAPVINLFELLPIKGFTYLLRVRAKDESAVIKLSYYNSLFDFKEFGHESLLSSDTDGWLFETPVNISYQGFRITDTYNNFKEYTRSQPILIDPTSNIPVYSSISPKEIYDIYLDIQNVTFLKNDINILNKPSYNTIYFNSTTIPIDYPLLFALGDAVTITIQGGISGLYSVGLTIGTRGFLPINYDHDKKLFYCNFIVPKNTNSGSIPYFIHSYYRYTSDVALESPLRVSRTEFDNEGPIITNIINANMFGKVGWRIRITDQTNGFSNGYIKAVGSLDSSTFNFNFTISNSNTGSTVWSGEYDIILNISTRCISQNYTIEYIYLEDTNNLYSYFTRFGNYYHSVMNPLRNYLANLDDHLITESICTNSIQDSTPPELVSFTSNRLSLDVGQIDRTVSFKFTARDLESGLMETQRPIVYLQESVSLKQIQCESTITSINNTHAEYYCEIELPIGFGYQYYGGILISVYGFINNAALFSGFSSDIISTYTTISTIYTLSNLLTGYEPYYYYSTSDLILYGKWLASTTSLSIQYSDGTTKSYSTIKTIGQSALLIQRNDYQVIGAFNVTAIMNSGIKSNTITVYPIYYNTTEEPDTPTPTNEPQQCLGNPICGGPSNGYCNENTGCVCYSPWIGNDCLSKVIIIPQPNVNDTEPTIEIPIDNGSEVFYSSLVSIVSLREISINNKVIHEHQFEKWILTQIDPSTSQYYSNITFKTNLNINQTFEIYSTLKWFNNETTIEFANQQIKMNPSSMKYTIDIFDYPFESRLNRLQLVMFASFLSNKTNDICSSKEFGDTTSGDSSNYIKIKVNNTSLYGRFIKRGIIDDKIISLSNDILDKEMSAINNPHQVQSYIGISIPWFERHSTIDPDFSVIIDSSSSSTCSSNDSKLSSTRIAGIIIGCVGFAIVAAVSITYIVYQRKRQNKLLSITGNKLKKLNQDH